MANTWLDSFKGQHITVITTVGSEERTDTGKLLEMGEGWMQVQKDNGDMILIPSTAIRLVKLLNMTHTLPIQERSTDVTHDNRIYEPNAQTL